MLLAMSSVSAQGDASVRFVHVVPGAPAVDVFVNGTQAASSLDYGSATNYISVPSGEHSVTVTAEGSTSPLWEQTINVSADASVTYIASSPDAPQFSAFPDNLSNTALGNTRLLLVHALAGGPPVDVNLAEEVTLNGQVQEAGTPLAQGMAYDSSVGAFDIPAQTYSVNVLPTEGTAFEALLSSVALPLYTGTSYMAVVYGTADRPQALLLGAPTAAADDSGFLRVVHGVVDGSAVDVYINGSLVFPMLTPNSPTAHVAVPAGDHEIVLFDAGTEEELLSGTFSIEAGQARTLAALSDESGLQLGDYVDDISGVNATTAVASVLNTISNSSVTVALDDGTTLTEGLEFANASDAVTFAPITAGLDFTLTLADATGDIESPQQTFYGGVYYNVIVLDGNAFSGPSLLVAGTALQQTLDSAPGDATLASGESETDVDAPSDNNVTAPQATQPAPPQLPQTTTDASGVTARVLLDPSANLQLRQYPRPDALSLGLAPSGTVLEVNGREGRPVALVEGQDPPPEAEDYVDPATLLEDEDDDLNPEETWLNVTYETPDGGEIIAWVLSQYLEVRDEEGDLQRLADLPTVARNIAGEAVDTELTPPPIPEDRVTGTVTGLNPGVNLNVRRTPTTAGEVLVRLPGGTVVEVIGFSGPDVADDVTPTAFDPTESEWAFIRYTPAEGGEVTGWVSTLYLEYAYNGRDVDVDELFEREVVEIIPEDRRGEVGGGAEAAPLPTVDPLEDAYVGIVTVNPGSNLQFRLDPDATSESLNLIPSGTQLILEARTPDSEWIRTEFEGQTGWVAADFLDITFNGNRVDVQEIPVAETANETDE
jgi:uncharacterized protein YgiM (DUF1202 family)